MGKKIIKKLYVVRKYIYAKSAQEALKLEKKIDSDDVWVDDDWKKSQEFSTNVVGFQIKKKHLSTQKDNKVA